MFDVPHGCRSACRCLYFHDEWERDGVSFRPMPCQRGRLQFPSRYRSTALKGRAQEDFYPRLWRKRVQVCIELRPSNDRFDPRAQPARARAGRQSESDARLRLRALVLPRRALVRAASGAIALAWLRYGRIDFMFGLRPRSHRLHPRILRITAITYGRCTLCGPARLGAVFALPMVCRRESAKALSAALVSLKVCNLRHRTADK